MSRTTSSGTPTEGASPARGRAFGASRSRVIAWVCALLLVVMLVLHAFFYETFTVPSGSMEPTYAPGDRIVVDKRFGALERGDVIVFSGAGSIDPEVESSGVRRVLDDAVGLLGFRPGETDYLKRVIGVGGDRVSVDASGVLRVNGAVQHETYLGGLTTASRVPFSVRVPAGALFVMGDNRDASDDSRNHLGDPGGGFVREKRVIGTVRWTYWPRR